MNICSLPDGIFQPEKYNHLPVGRGKNSLKLTTIFVSQIWKTIVGYLCHPPIKVAIFTFIQEKVIKSLTFVSVGQWNLLSFTKPNWPSHQNICSPWFVFKLKFLFIALSINGLERKTCHRNSIRTLLLIHYNLTKM